MPQPETAPPAVEPALAPAGAEPVLRAEEPVQPVMVAAVQPIEAAPPRPPIEATPQAPPQPAAPPADPTQSGSPMMKRTMLGIGNPLAAGSAATASAAIGAGMPPTGPATSLATAPAPMQRTPVQKTMIGLAPVEPSTSAGPRPQAPQTASSLVVHEPTPPPRSSPVTANEPLPSVVVKDSVRPPAPIDPGIRADSVWDDPRPNVAEGFGAPVPARRSEAFVSDAEIAALGRKSSRGVVVAVLGAAAVLLAVVGVKALMDRGSDADPGELPVTTEPVKAADPAPEPVPPPPVPAPPLPAETAAAAEAPSEAPKAAASAEEPASEPEEPRAAVAKEAPTAKPVKRRAAPAPRKQAPVAKRPRPAPRPAAEDPAPPKAGSGAIVRETPF